MSLFTSYQNQAVYNKHQKDLENMQISAIYLVSCQNANFHDKNVYKVLNPAQ